MTTHVVVEGGEVIAELGGWNPLAVAALLRDRGVNVSPQSVPPVGPLDLGPLRILPATDDRPTPDEGEAVSGRTWTVTETSAWTVYTFGPAPPAAVPRVVTNFQARAALMAAGLFETVNAAVMGGEDALAKQAWEYANEITRDGALVNSLAAGLGLTSAQLDDLFRAASVIEA